MNACRLIIDPPAEGAWNMALDEALLESAQRDGISTLRFYSWREPTLSLGYFQPHADRQQHRASAGCALVRRASGGGAILHDRELTYSIALPRNHPLAARAEQLYQAVHESLIDTLAEFGLSAKLQELPLDTSNQSQLHVNKAFLCFQRRERGDVLAGECKIAGSAQRRQRGAVLQHGSVLLARSRFAPELPGIAELLSDEVNIQRLRQAWLVRLAKRLKMDVSQAALPDTLLQAAREIAERKFAHPDWTCHR